VGSKGHEAGEGVQEVANLDAFIIVNRREIHPAVPLLEFTPIEIKSIQLPARELHAQLLCSGHQSVHPNIIPKRVKKTSEESVTPADPML
jgi:hypothetical protein